MSSLSLNLAFPSCLPSVSTKDFGTYCKIATLKLASYLTDPICNVRDYAYTFYKAEDLFQGDAKIVIWAKKFFLILGIALYAPLAPFTAPLGVALRSLVRLVQDKPFIYLEADPQKGKQLPLSLECTAYQQNVCLMKGGYNITDGQVSSSSERIDPIIKDILEEDQDVVCLSEVPDIVDADYLSKKIRHKYPFIIPIAGVRGIGPSSMLYIASKYEIVKESIEFAPFPKECMSGRASKSEKGVLSFDLKSQGQDKAFIRVFSTHLQHSEESAFPQEEEVAAREAQMQFIMTKINAVKDKAVLFLGDLNLSDEPLDVEKDKKVVRQNNEFENASWSNRFIRNVTNLLEKTWGGDSWCTRFMDKRASKPLTLDYALLYKGSAHSITTKVQPSTYDGSKFVRSARSDHKALLTRVIMRF